ncbi:MFS transporter [Agrilactobacillus fermenti]|uniref:MFS transporter n=1 Tax=Agrilactobacillus fermenti TaxID=2586909 RepID=UPI003A5C55E7
MQKFLIKRSKFGFIKRNKQFTQLTSINLFSKIGDRLFYTTMLTLAAALPQANIAVMIISISETVPILMGIILGNLADKQPRKFRGMIQSSLTRALLYLSIGLLLNYRSTLSLIVIIATLNFISDLFGNYSSALSAPFTKILVSADDMTQAQGLVSITSQLVNVLATLGGSLLLTIFLAKTIAVINAGVFLLVSVFFGLLSTHFATTENKIIDHTSKRPVWRLVVENLQTLVTNKKALNDLCQLALINGFFGGITPIFVLFLQKTKVIIFSRAITISLLSSLITLGLIIGSALSLKVWRNITTHVLCCYANLLIVVTSLGFILNQLYIILLGSSLTALLLGIVSPRFSTMIINHYPAERLGGIVTTVNSLLVLTPPLTSFIFPVLANFGLTFSYYCLGVYGLMLLSLSYLILHRQTNSTTLN